MKKIIAMLGLIIPLGCSTVAYARQADTNIDDYYIDFSVPDLTAFTLLGVNASDVTRPGNIKELTAALLNSASEFGNNAQGIAIEWAPFRSAMPRSQTIKDYQSTVFFQRLTTSLAAVNDSNASRIGLGFKWVLIDHSDPIGKKGKALQDSVLAIFERISEEDPLASAKRNTFMYKVTPFFARIQPDLASRVGLLTLINPDTTNNPKPDILGVESAMFRLLARLDEQNIVLSNEQEDTLRTYAEEYVLMIQQAMGVRTDEKASELVKQAKEKFEQDKWNALVAEVALGTTFRADNSSLDSLKADQLSAFAGVAFPLMKAGQGVFHAQYNTSYQEDAMEKWKWSLGARLLLGSSTKRFSIEGQLSESKNTNEDLDGRKWRVTFGGEFKLSSGLWLELASGLNIPEADKATAGLFTLGGFKYAFHKKRRFDIP